MVKWIAGGAGLALLIGCLIAVYGFGPKDDELIFAALEESIEASREGRPYGVLEQLATGFTYNGEQPRSRAEIARVIRELKPGVTFPSRSIRIEDSQASLVSPALVTFGQGGSVQLERVEVIFRKGTGTRWGIFPYPSWKVSSVKAEGFDPGALLGSMPF